MITPSYSFTATERVLPRLALDFTTAALDSRITFSRTTGASNPATYVNSSGVITAATNNQPRFDYNAVTLACKGLLIEESRTNLCLYSQDLGNANWAKNNSSVVTDTVVSPDGTTNADKLVENATSNVHNALVALSVTSGVTYTVSAFMKKAERGYALISSLLGFPTTAIQINLTSGAVTTGTGTPINAISQDFGNGWFRVGFSITATSTRAAQFVFYTSADGLWANRVYLGDGASGIYVWGAQVETGAFATSYIPTEATALTRNADVATMTGANFSNWFNATEGSFSSSVSIPYTITTQLVSPFSVGDAGSNNNLIDAYADSTNLTYIVSNSGSNQATIPIAGSFSKDVITKFAYCYKVNSFAFARNTVLGTPDNSGTVPAVTQLRIGNRQDEIRTLNGHIQNIMYYPQRLTNAELQAFSKG